MKPFKEMTEEDILKEITAISFTREDECPKYTLNVNKLSKFLYNLIQHYEVWKEKKVDYRYNCINCGGELHLNCTQCSYTGFSMECEKCKKRYCPQSMEEGNFEFRS